MDYVKILEEAGAILSGHFVLTNGIHSEKYIQSSRITRNPELTERLCAALASKLKATLPTTKFDLIVSPAMGGIIPGYEMARQMNIQAIYCERVNGKLQLRRTFEIPKGANVLIVEDVISMGKTSIETFDCVAENGGKVVAEAALVYRGDSPFNPPFPLVSLVNVEIKTYHPNEVPEYLQKIPIQKPGSRFLNSSAA
jgi:orotate phosphoribosyltransferase